MDHGGGSTGCKWHVAVTPGLETFACPEVGAAATGECAILTYIVASFVLGGISAIAAQWCWCVTRQWWAKRVERFLSRLEHDTSKLIREKRYQECTRLLERGVTYLLSQSNVDDLSSVRHLLAKVKILDGRPQDAEALLVDLTRHYERSDCGEKILTEALEDLGRALSMQHGREKEAASVWQRCVDMRSIVDGEGEEDLSTLIGSLERISSSNSESPAVNRYLSAAFSPMVSPIAVTRKSKGAAAAKAHAMLAELNASPTTDQELDEEKEEEEEEEEDIETST